MAKAMKDYKYNLGLKLRIYPNYQQRKIIKMSSDASRFVYNEMVYLNLELWKFGNPKIAGVTEKIEQLRFLKESTTQLKDRYYWLRDKDVDSLAIDNAKLNYQKAWKLYRKIDSHGTPNFKRKSYI
ncbi:MAG: helix-turn-helix domain-containing protein [Selenomonadaceae bacterium]|nr:helix-turn-helix domain-containing protein [Selenomonadaceae bacterium]